MVRRLPLLAVLGTLSCNPPIDTDTGESTLTVTIPASYAAIHGGQTFAMALVETSEGVELDTQLGLVPASGSEEVVFADLLAEGVQYELHLWIDANQGGGTAGNCDGAPDFFDHQWVEQVGEVAEDTEFPWPDHNVEFDDVCGTAGSGE